MNNQPQNPFRRCGEILIKFDDHGQPEYGFTYDAYHRTLKKFYDLQEPSLLDTVSRGVKRIELPTWQVDVDNQKMLAALQNYSVDRTFAEQALTDYAQGGMKIADGCFAGLKELQLVVPGDYSVMLDWGCFDDQAQVELVLPHDMDLKQVFRTFDAGYDYEHENWTLIAHRDFNWQNDDVRDSYGVSDFRATDSRCQFAISHPAKLSTCTVTPVYANLKLHPYHRPTAHDVRPITPDNEPTL